MNRRLSISHRRFPGVMIKIAPPRRQHPHIPGQTQRIEWLYQHTRRAAHHQLSHLVALGTCRKEDDGYHIAQQRTQTVERFRPVKIGHRDVEQHHIGSPRPIPHHRNRIGAGKNRTHGKCSVEVQRSHDDTYQIRLVINVQQIKGVTNVHPPPIPPHDAIIPLRWKIRESLPPPRSSGFYGTISGNEQWKLTTYA